MSSNSKYTCPCCGAALDEQWCFSESDENWECTECGSHLYHEYSDEDYIVIKHICPSCQAPLDIQSGFSEYKDDWKCTECGVHLHHSYGDDEYQEVVEPKYRCPRCGAALDEQWCFSESDENWECTECGSHLYHEYSDEDYIVIKHICPSCQAPLDIQSGFSEYKDDWKCTECGAHLHHDLIQLDHSGGIFNRLLNVYLNSHPMWEDYTVIKHVCPNCEARLDLQPGFSEYNDDWKLTIEEFINYINDDVITDSRFIDFIKDELKDKIKSSKDKVMNAKDLLVGDNYSRVVINTDLAPEGKDTFDFINNEKNNVKKYSKDFYFIGNSPMALDMSESFGSELDFITILTMIAIFVAVAITFKSLLIPTILVFIIQCAVYLTMGILTMLGGTVYFIALLIVQSILMGATIDYAIVYTSYYIESRESMNVKESIINSYQKSIHTILTSSSILIIVTFIVGNFANAIAAKICMTLSRGTLCSVILILTLLPAILAITDKIIIKKKTR